MTPPPTRSAYNDDDSHRPGIFRRREMERHHIPILMVWFAVAAVLVGLRTGEDDLPPALAALTAPADAHRPALKPLSRGIDDATAREIRRLSDATAALIMQGETRLAGARLISLAADAASAGDKARLAHILLLLGDIATEDLELDSAEVFLLEALDLYDAVDDAVGMARVQMQLGRMHLKARQIARTAAQAYDRLLVARWELDHQQYTAAEQHLREVIDSNLSVNRYGAAASAYASLMSLYRETNDGYRAEAAAVEAARLYAASGQHRRARAVLASLEAARIEPGRLLEIESEIEQNIRQFDDGVAQIERARDYQRLYHHYRARGDDERAWALRVRWSESLARAPKRAMYHRQPDVLAVLYNSNESMSRARAYLQRAHDVFTARGHDELSSEIMDLTAQIF